MGKWGRRQWSVLAAIAVVGVVAAGVVALPDGPTRHASSEPSPVELVVPDTERRIPVPEWRGSFVSLSDDALLSVGWERVEPGRVAVLDLDTETWQDVDRPTVDGEMERPRVAQFGDDALLWGSSCPGFTGDDLESDYHPCERGYRGLEIWLFDHSELKWSRVGVFSAEALGDTDDTTISVSYLGAHADSAYFAVFDSEYRRGDKPRTERSLRAVHVPTGTLRSVLPSPPSEVSQVLCITGQGDIVGSADEVPGVSDEFDVAAPLPPPALAVLRSGSGAWSYHPVELPGGELDVTCATQSILVAGLPSDDDGSSTWQELAPDGELLGEGAIDVEDPLEQGNRRRYDRYLTNPHAPPSLVRVISETSRERGSQGRRVVLPTLDADPIVVETADSPYGDGLRLSDGTIVLVVERDDAAGEEVRELVILE